MALSSQTLVPETNTAPDSRDTVSRPANRSPVLAASARAASSWASPSTLIPSEGRSFSFGQVSEVFCTQNDTNGGSRETGAKGLGARPGRQPSPSAGNAEAADGKWPDASPRV